MLIVISLLAIVAGLAAWAGFQQKLRLEQLSGRILLNSILLAMALLTLLAFAQWLGLLSHKAAGWLTMGVYALATGFFSGNGVRLVLLRKKAGPIAYMHRDFWTDVAPNIAAVLLVAYGLFRTGIVTLGPFTGIGLSSGLSLIAFGFWGWTVRIVPEFRSRGLLLLDRFIPWQEVLSYRWAGETVIEIDYLAADGLMTAFRTYIPAEDQLELERLLGKKMKEYEERRKQNLEESETS